MDEETLAALRQIYPQFTERQLSLISMEAWDRGHSAGQSEVNMIATSLAAFVADILA